MYERNDRGFPPKPVDVGEEIEVTIEAVGEKGDGVAKRDGFVLFIPGAKQGQRVKVRVTKVLRKVGFAEIIGEASGEAPSGGAPSAPMPAAEPEPVPEDSDDFGEEAPAESEEAPAEEAPMEEAEEAPAESEEPKQE